MLAIIIAEQQTSLFHFFYYLLLSLWSSSSPTPGLSFIPILLLRRSSKALPRLTIISKELLCWLYTTMIIIFKLHCTLLNHCHTASPQTNEADQTGGFILSFIAQIKVTHAFYIHTKFIHLVDFIISRFNLFWCLLSVKKAFFCIVMQQRVLRQGDRSMNRQMLTNQPLKTRLLMQSSLNLAQQFIMLGPFLLWMLAILSSSETEVVSRFGCFLNKARDSWLDEHWFFKYT